MSSSIVIVLFLNDGSTPAAVEFWVSATTLLLLARFTVGSIGPRFFSSRRLVAPVLRLLHMLNSYSLSYTLGLMKPAAASPTGGAAVSDLFQVWAVLIVIMQASARIGRPYRAKEMTLLDLLSSLWSADQLRTQTRPRLAVPLWLIWSVHALRVAWYHVSSSRAGEATPGNIKLVSDYMLTSHHTDGDASPATMQGYRYIVAGEEEQAEEVRAPGFTREMDLTTTGRPGSSNQRLLITVDKVWNQESSDRLLGAAADGDGRFKDVCLSFALYKLQRRRFFDFPIAEAAHPATRRLVSEALLEEGANGSYDRALRVTEVELSFLHDFFYSAHPVVFAGGFPCVRLLLSALMAASVLYLFHAVGDIPSSGTAVAAASREGKQKHVTITHGVLIAHCVIAVVLCRELVEAAIYVFSQWTKVRIICHYVKLKLQRRRRHGRIAMAVTEKLARIMFRIISRGRWDQRVIQYNLLTAALPGSRHPALARLYAGWPGIRAFIPRKVKLQSEVKRALFQSMKNLIDNIPSPVGVDHSDPWEPSSAWAQQMDSLLMSYFRNAFVDDDDADGSSSPPLIEDATADLRGETHKILVWHIATGLCHIKLLEEAGRPAAGVDDDLPAMTPPLTGDLAAAWPHLVAAVTLSNYCGYLATQALVPDNGLVAGNVLGAVLGEVRGALVGCTAAGEIRGRLGSLARDGSAGTTIAGMGARLSEELVSAYDDAGELWGRLARFWAGLLLHLSASTRSAKHKIYLQGRGELTTHLWLLLSHAGFLGKTSHGEQLLDPADLNNA
ncbi:uncharacterized protein C2845_PM18G01800 [Panicum miliaceum]|uniref:DUF4220 domain-containing protein n=1 Tax=Panicum miliaceum TaxID=4540 RepID=A0A3L6PHU8_PANMI|nr:uncharacterized protein C2845_PM18G01800 [Panicum miliaceum]